MKVFLRCSGNLSHKVALVFRDWLPSVIQSIDPYVSSEALSSGFVPCNRCNPKIALHAKHI